MSRISKVTAIPFRTPRESAKGLAGSPTATAGEGRYRWSTAYPVLYPVDFETALVRIELSDGTVGWGEAQAPLAPEVACAIIDVLLGPVLVGREFGGTREEIAEIREVLYSTMRVRGHSGGFMLDAMAGIDIALWDLAGKQAGLPVARMLGATTMRVPAYVSGVAGATDAERVAFVQQYVSRGFTVFKIYLEESWEELVRRVAMLQREFPGIRFAVDGLWHMPEGAGMELDVEWVECPFWPEDVSGHLAWAKSARSPLALGESYRTRQEVSPFLSGVQVLQPDLGRCGITETLRWAELGKRIVPHVSIAMAPQILAAVHVAAALGCSQLCEFNPKVLEVANRFADVPIAMDGPCYVVPETPGIGGAGNFFLQG